MCHRSAAKTITPLGTYIAFLSETAFYVTDMYHVWYKDFYNFELFFLAGEYLMRSKSNHQQSDNVTLRSK